MRLIITQNIFYEVPVKYFACIFMGFRSDGTQTDVGTRLAQ